MADKHDNQADTHTVPDSGSSLVIFGTLLDTTWRMFTPVLVLLVLGLWLDGKTDKKPLFSLGGVLLGFVLAIALVWQQTRSITKGTKK